MHWQPVAFTLLPSRKVLWTFSIYLEAVAILPQLVLLQRTQNIDNLTGNYVFLIGCAPPQPCLTLSCCWLYAALANLASCLQPGRTVPCTS